MIMRDGYSNLEIRMECCSQVSVDPSRVYVGGQTSGTFPDQNNLGDSEVRFWPSLELMMMIKTYDDNKHVIPVPKKNANLLSISPNALLESLFFPISLEPIYLEQFA